MGEDLADVPLRVSRYFLTPCEKWDYGRRPFKLITQIFKIIIITIQIYRFGSLTQGFQTFKTKIKYKLELIYLILLNFVTKLEFKNISKTQF